MLQIAAALFEHLKYFISKNSYLMQLYEINIYQVMIFRFDTIYKKHDMIKLGNQTKEKSQALSQLLE